MTNPAAAPQHVFVAFCLKCGDPINAKPTQAGAARSSGDCECEEGTDSDEGTVGVAQYRLVPKKERSGRKPRRNRR